MKALFRPAVASTALAATVALATLPLAASCGGSSTPTVVPTPVPTPTPAPTPTPDPNVPPAGSGCGEPYPPPVSRFQVYVHQKDKDFWQVDSTPLVGPDRIYCHEIGFTDGRSFCPVRTEGSPDREACELWRVGKAKDTGKAGPTWTFTAKDGKQSYCATTESPDAPCLHYDEEGHYFQIKAIQGGLYQACSEAGACGQTDVDRGL